MKNRIGSEEWETTEHVEITANERKTNFQFVILLSTVNYSYLLFYSNCCHIFIIETKNKMCFSISFREIHHFIWKWMERKLGSEGFYSSAKITIFYFINRENIFEWIFRMCRSGMLYVFFNRIFHQLPINQDTTHKSWLLFQHIVEWWPDETVTHSTRKIKMWILVSENCFQFTQWFWDCCLF